MKNKKIIIGIAALVILIAAALGVYFVGGAKTEKGAKTVTIQVVDDKGDKTDYEIHTDAEYLTQVLDEAKEKGFAYEGEKGEFGLSIHTVNGLKADYNEGGAYWGFYVNDEYCNYGPDEQPVADGDKFRIEYSIWKEE